jgi:hypothetical protein
LIEWFVATQLLLAVVTVFNQHISGRMGPLLRVGLRRPLETALVPAS